MAMLDIRPMHRDELATAIDWAAAEGWNPGLADTGPFLAEDPEGFLMAWRDGIPVACISVVAYGETYGFLGFYICVPEARGQGIGLAIWQAGMARLGGRVVGLDGVMAQQENYRRSGFVLAQRNVRFGGVLGLFGSTSPAVVPVDGTLLGRVLDYDRAFFPADRRRFLCAWLSPDRRQALACVADGAVRGYGVVRVCREGHKIGPLFADDAVIAEDLFHALVNAAGGGLVFVDPPEPNGAAVAMYRHHGLRPVFETARMYRGSAPDLPLERTFGITTFELG